jgi:hypothetical protein
MSGLQQLVLHLEVSVQQHVACSVPAACATPGLSLYKSMFCSWTCLSTRDLCALVVSVYKSLCCTYARLQELFLCIWTCLSTGACAALVFVCLQELWATPGDACLQEPVLHLSVSVYKSLCAAPVYMDVSVFKSL